MVVEGVTAMQMGITVTKKVERFFSQFPLRHYDKGQILIYGGDEPKGVFYLVSGEVRQYDIAGSGDELVVNIFRPVAFFPMRWAVNTQEKNRFFYEATRDVSVHVTPAAATVAFLQEHPDVMYDLLSRLYTGMDGLLLRLLYLMKGTAYTRVVLELVLAARRAIITDQECILEVREGELAARAGLARETVSRELQKLQGKGLVKVRHKQIVIMDLAALASELGDGP